MRKQKSFCNEQKENIKEKTNDENAKIKKNKNKGNLAGGILEEETRRRKENYSKKQWQEISQNCWKRESLNLSSIINHS